MELTERDIIKAGTVKENIVFPFGSHELDYFELNIRLKQIILLERHGFTHVCEHDIPLSSDDFPIGEYKKILIEAIKDGASL